MELYKFERLSRKMDDWGFPRIDTDSGFKVIQRDFEEAFRAGEIRFEWDGIYLDYEGKSYKGYMFIKEYHVTRYSDFPRFHVIKCETIQKFMQLGIFNQRYIWSNSATNDVVDIDTDTVHPDLNLRLCRNCNRQINDSYYSTDTFHELLKGDAVVGEKIEVDIFGYDRNWLQISKAYRKKVNFTCEECGIKITNNFDRRFLHVHHINGDKLNNHESNLKCLCILCHSYTDVGHQHNFNAKRNKSLLKAFVRTFKEDLIQLNNIFLNKFNG